MLVLPHAHAMHARTRVHLATYMPTYAPTHHAPMATQVLDSCLSGEMRYSIDGKTHPWSGSVCLRDLAGLIGELFKKCIGNLGG